MISLVQDHTLRLCWPPSSLSRAPSLRAPPPSHLLLSILATLFWPPSLGLPPPGLVLQQLHELIRADFAKNHPKALKCFVEVDLLKCDRLLSQV
jgi:hypothetical protein